MSAISVIYSWNPPEGTLDLIPAEKGYAFCLQLLDQTRVLIPATTDHSRLFSEAQNVAAVCEQYFPTLNQDHGKWTVLFELSGFLIEEGNTQNKNLAFSNFSFNSLDNKTLVKFIKNGPHYHRVNPGLNLEGECDNKECDANKNHHGFVILRKGMGSFNIALLKRSSCCPNCKQKIAADKINDLGFWKCNFKIAGFKADTSELIQREEVAVATHYTTFKKGDDCAWESLQITTTPLTASSKPKTAFPAGAKDASSSSTCAIS